MRALSSKFEDQTTLVYLFFYHENLVGGAVDSFGEVIEFGGGQRFPIYPAS